MHLGGFNFSALLQPLKPPKKWFFGRFFLFFECISRQLPFNSSQEDKIWLVDSVEVLDVPFEDYKISTSLHLLSAMKKLFLVDFSNFFSISRACLISKSSPLIEIWLADSLEILDMPF